MTEEKLPKIEIVVSPVYDVLTGLALVARHLDCEEGDIDLVRGIPKTELVEQIRANMRPRLLANLDLFFDTDCYPGLGLTSVIQEWGAMDVPGFLQTLYQKPLPELARALLSFGKVYRGNRLLEHTENTIEDLMSDQELLTHHIEQNMAVSPEKVGGLVEMITNPEVARDNIAELIEYFWYVVMSPEAEKRAQIQEQAAEMGRSKMNEVGPRRFLMAVTDLELSDGKNGYETVILAASSYAQGTVGNENPAETTLIIVFGPDLKSLKALKLADEGTTPLDLENLENLYKVLGDKTRLLIVRALAERPYYGQELAKEFGITNATVFYHLSMLMKTGAVHLERIEHRVYYVLNVEQLHRILAQANSFLLGVPG